MVYHVCPLVLHALWVVHASPVEDLPASSSGTKDIKMDRKRLECASELLHLVVLCVQEGCLCRRWSFLWYGPYHIDWCTFVNQILGSKMFLKCCWVLHIAFRCARANGAEETALCLIFNECRGRFHCSRGPGFHSGFLFRQISSLLSFCLSVFLWRFRQLAGLTRRLWFKHITPMWWWISKCDFKMRSRKQENLPVASVIRCILVTASWSALMVSGLFFTKRRKKDSPNNFRSPFMYCCYFFGFRQVLYAISYFGHSSTMLLSEEHVPQLCVVCVGVRG